MHDSKYVLVERERLERLERVVECARDIALSAPEFFDPRYYEYRVSGEDMEDLIAAVCELAQQDWDFTIRNAAGDEWRIRYHAQPIRGIIRARAQVQGGGWESAMWNRLAHRYGWEQETPPNEGGCWICHRATGDDWLFSMEYDCHVHKSCLERAEPDEEVELIRQELGIEPRTNKTNI